MEIMPEHVQSKLADLKPCLHGPLKVAATKSGPNAGKWYAACPAPRNDPNKCRGTFQWLDEGAVSNKRPRTENGSTFSGAGFAQPSEVMALLKELKGALEDQRAMLEQLLQRTATE